MSVHTTTTGAGSGTLLAAPVVSDDRTPQGVELVSAAQTHFALAGDAVTRMEFENEKTRLLAEEAQDAAGDGGEAAFGSPGMMPEEVYERTMAPWRAALRRAIVSNMENESRWLAAMQKRVRTPWLDSYFVGSSILGTHTFFMIGLPMCWFFGYGDVGFGVLFVMSSGVYVSSFLKDLVCSPRPFSPPVTRLTIGTHHLEYGFPSTHTTNAVSITLFFLCLTHAAYAAASISAAAYYATVALLALYGFSVVYGRLYTGMHSFTDVSMGIVLGTGTWWLQWMWGAALLQWTAQSGWIVPAVVIPLTILMVNQHPQPVDDCPCFEDAIAFVSVQAGIILGQWHAAHNGLSPASFTARTPGSASASADPADWALLAFYVTLKVVVGVLIIFTWRIAAKSTLHAVLPPFFRLLAQGFDLPHRRFYTPATEYERMPLEKGLYPIPSVIDLPGQLQQMAEAEASGWHAGQDGAGQDVKMRGGRSIYMNGHGLRHGNGLGDEKRAMAVHFELEPEVEKDAGKHGKGVKHYDADVMTKVVVYAGIAILACEFIPLMFDRLGWGVFMA